MTRADIPLMAAQLNAMAEVFGKPPVSLKAMDIWFDALKEFPTERVMDCLNGWARWNGRFPTPAQAWERVNGTLTDEREKRALVERVENRSPSGYHQTTEAGKRFIAEIREILKRQKISPRQHWENVLAGDYPERSKMMAREALSKIAGSRHQAAKERVPGEDDE